MVTRAFQDWFASVSSSKSALGLITCPSSNTQEQALEWLCALVSLQAPASRPGFLLLGNALLEAHRGCSSGRDVHLHDHELLSFCSFFSSRFSSLLMSIFLPSLRSFRSFEKRAIIAECFVDGIDGMVGMSKVVGVSK